MLVLIGGEKGGTGKSTLATNLAAWLACHGKDVLVLDSDRQATSANWATERSQCAALPTVHCVQRHGNLAAAINDLKTRYEEVIIDAGGRDSEELRSAMVVAEVILSPVRPSQSDLWTVAHLAKLVSLAKGLNPKLVAYALISMAPTHHLITETKDATELLAEFRALRLATTVISERKAYRDAMYSGRSVVEMSDPKASREIEALAQEIYRGQIQGKPIADVA